MTGLLSSIVNPTETSKHDKGASVRALRTPLEMVYDVSSVEVRYRLPFL